MESVWCHRASSLIQFYPVFHGSLIESAIPNTRTHRIGNKIILGLRRFNESTNSLLLYFQHMRRHNQPRLSYLNTATHFLPVSPQGDHQQSAGPLEFQLWHGHRKAFFKFKVQKYLFVRILKRTGITRLHKRWRSEQGIELSSNETPDPEAQNFS